MPKFCGECGYEFDRDYKFCPECGTKVTDSAGNKKSDKSSKQHKVKQAEIDDKQLNPKVISGIFAAGIIAIFIIMYATGTFDSPQISQTSLPTQSGSGVDLNNLNMINQLEEKLKLNPEDYKTLLELAHLKNDSGLFEQAIMNYKTYLERHPEDADARIDMGVCYFNLRDYDNAKKEMLKALEYSPKHQIGHLNLGVVTLSAGNREESKDWFQKAIEIDPTTEVAKRAEELLKSH